MTDGASLNVGAIAGVERIKIRFRSRARSHQSTALLAGAGAEAFASQAGIVLCDPSALITPYQYARWRSGDRPGDGTHAGTESDVAPSQTAADGHNADADRYTPTTRTWHRGRSRDRWRRQHRASAFTGGRAGKHLGRVGETPLPGCGYYAENGIGGISCTGDGEDFIRLLLAKPSPISSPPGFPRREPPPPPFGCWTAHHWRGRTDRPG